MAATIESARSDSARPGVVRIPLRSQVVEVLFGEAEHGGSLGDNPAMEASIHAVVGTAPDVATRAALDLLHHAVTPLQGAVVARLFQACDALLRNADERLLGEAAGEGSSTAMLVRLLSAPQTLASLQQADPLAPARLRWVRHRDELLAAEGGVVSTDEAMSLLNVRSRQAVQQRVKRATLIGLPLNQTTTVYPIWQFSEKSRDRVLPGLREVLTALGDLDPWGRVIFFLGGEGRLDGERPLDVLRRGDVERVVEAARHYGEQGGE